ncbi:MAG: DUF1343 domain-containing protein [Firmicutes bacterium]|jgi:uncharacterized protein YbbC (DUF1343 family)|nr:DUF1343 domain-containing protein [Bacillota bacterium]
MSVKLGITKFLEDPQAYAAGAPQRGRPAGPGKLRVGVVANYNAIDEHAVPIIRAIAAHPCLHLAAIYSAEHGLWGCEQAGVKLAGSVDPHTGARVFSLYGDVNRPTPEMLEDVDLLLFDGNDVGSRYWTYLSTMALCIEAAAEAGKPIIVTDRPNPLGGAAVEGNVLDLRYRSFVGFLPIPIRHGMTPGELAKMHASSVAAKSYLTVVPVDGWHRRMLFPETGLFWTATPNMPDFETALLYPGTCLFEGTNCSEGRGTTKPFKLIGAPWLDALSLADFLNSVGLEGVRFRPAHFRPTFSKHSGAECAGVELYITDPRRIQPLRVGLEILSAVHKQNPDRFSWNAPFIDRLAGGPDLREAIDRGRTAEEILRSWAPQLDEFLSARKGYLLYD